MTFCALAVPQFAPSNILVTALSTKSLKVSWKVSGLKWLIWLTFFKNVALPLVPGATVISELRNHSRVTKNDYTFGSKSYVTFTRLIIDFIAIIFHTSCIIATIRPLSKQRSSLPTTRTSTRWPSWKRHRDMSLLFRHSMAKVPDQFPRR